VADRATGHAPVPIACPRCGAVVEVFAVLSSVEVHPRSMGDPGTLRVAWSEGWAEHDCPR